MADSTMLSYTEFRELVPVGSSADRLCDQAMVYVWGRQDEAGVVDTKLSVDFGRAYGVIAAEYLGGQRGSRPSIRSAYEVWTTTGVIE